MPKVKLYHACALLVGALGLGAAIAAAFGSPNIALVFGGLSIAALAAALVLHERRTQATLRVVLQTSRRSARLSDHAAKMGEQAAKMAEQAARMAEQAKRLGEQAAKESAAATLATKAAPKSVSESQAARHADRVVKELRRVETLVEAMQRRVVSSVESARIEAADRYREYSQHR